MKCNMEAGLERKIIKVTQLLNMMNGKYIVMGGALIFLSTFILPSSQNSANPILCLSLR